MAAEPVEPLPYATPVPGGRRTRWIIVILAGCLILSMMLIAAMAYVLVGGTQVQIATVITPPPPAPAPAVVMPAQSTTLTINQRRTEAIPGSNGTVFVSIGDITKGQVMLHVTDRDGKMLLSPTSFTQDQTGTFTVGKRTYQITATALHNKLIGNDVAIFDVAPATAPVK